MRNSCCLAFETWRAKATALSAWASVKRACSKNTSPLLLIRLYVLCDLKVVLRHLLLNL